jgi:hypothetical protein
MHRASHSQSRTTIFEFEVEAAGSLFFPIVPQYREYIMFTSWNTERWRSYLQLGRDYASFWPATRRDVPEDQNPGRSWFPLLSRLCKYNTWFKVVRNVKIACCWTGTDTFLETPRKSERPTDACGVATSVVWEGIHAGTTEHCVLLENHEVWVPM